MNRYDKIWVPSNSATMDGGYKVMESSFFQSHLVAEVRPERDVIVLTIEELEYVFAAGAMYGAKRYHPEWEERPDFKTYLKSKGIEL